jgi:hypothetical protein
MRFRDSFLASLRGFALTVLLGIVDVLDWLADAFMDLVERIDPAYVDEVVDEPERTPFGFNELVDAMRDLKAPADPTATETYLVAEALEPVDSHELHRLADDGNPHHHD